MNKPLNKLRILFIAGTLGQGGAEKQLYYILQALRDAQCELLLICLTKDEFWQKPIEELGIPIIWAGKHHSPILRLVKIFKIVAGFSPDIIQSHHFYTNLYTALAGRFFNIPHIGGIRSNLTVEIKNNGFFGVWCLRLPKYLAANSRAAITKALQLGISPKNIFYLPNVIDCDSISPKLIKNTGQRFRLLSVGTLKPEKNYGVLVDICAQLKDRLDICAVLVGDGPERNMLEEKARQSGLQADSFCFSGQIENTLPYYQNSDVLVLTSLLEGTPNVVMEAMACGLPVVATHVGGVPDLIEDGVTGYLVEPGDNECEQFVNHLWRLANDHNLREQIGQRAREFILEKHNSKSIELHLRKLYENCT